MRAATIYRFTPPKGRVSYFKSLPNVIRARREKGGTIDIMQADVSLFRALWLRITGADYRLPADYRVLAPNVAPPTTTQEGL